MEADQAPDSSNSHYTRVVHFQSLDRRSTNFRRANYGPKVTTPAEVIFPGMRSRMKKSRANAGFGIFTGDSRSFRVVANRARETKIVERRRSPGGARDNVVDFKRLRAKILLEPAVFT
ncbi:MAG TPA: hypothetical protein VMV69_27015 [Pirellulales bacterium]|nr:hypothetical protein [Pirellulales bacterium]